MKLPNMKKTLRGWTQWFSVTIRTQKLINHVLDWETSSARIKANLQPIPQTKIDKKVGEERTWKWWTLVIEIGQLLKSQDQIIIKEKKYKIMSVGDYNDYGFRSYEVVEVV